MANGLTALAGRVRQAHGYYQRTDADVAASLEQIESEMNR